jgi:hypothetical protein
MMSDQFDDERLRRAYAPVLRAASSGHGPDCPSPEALLAASRGEGAERRRLEVLDHALRCAACRPELALLHSVSAPATGGLRLVTARGSSWRRFAPLAAAAAVLLAVGLVTFDGSRQDEDVTRSGAGRIALLAPPSEEVATAGQVTFVWHRVPGAIHYTLEVNANDGTLLFTARSTDTVYTAANLAGGEQRWSVRARMDDGTERRSISRVLRLK